MPGPSLDSPNLDPTAAPAALTGAAGAGPPGVLAVTGGAGFLGTNIVRRALAGGWEVRVVEHPAAPAHTLAGLPVDLRRADITDAAAVRAALRGSGALIHAAARYALWDRHPDAFVRDNVVGTRTVLQTAAELGIGRVVYTSSVSTVGPARDGRLADERDLQSPQAAPGPYARSKVLAEAEARRWVERGLDVVIVCPTTPVGPWDWRPTPTGAMVLRFLRGRMYGYLAAAGFNLVDARDVAEGHLLALERGQSGRRYILGGDNVTMRRAMQLLAAETGLRAPRLRVPYPTVLLAAELDERLLAPLLRRPPAVPRAAAREARMRMWVDTSRARAELGYQSRPAATALRAAAEWYVRNGYVRATPRCRGDQPDSGF